MCMWMYHAIEDSKDTLRLPECKFKFSMNTGKLGWPQYFIKRTEFEETAMPLNLEFCQNLLMKYAGQDGKEH